MNELRLKAFIKISNATKLSYSNLALSSICISTHDILLSVLFVTFNAL